MEENIKQLLRLITEGNPFQAKYIKKMLAEVIKLRELDILYFLSGFFCQQGITIKEQADAYLNLCRNIAIEQMYFKKNHRYSQNNYDKVCQTVYANNQYMSDYMIALAISGCIWWDHIHILRWYEEELKAVCANKIHTYLEVGCGMGINLLHAMQAIKAEQYWAIDLSEKSVELTKDLLLYAKEKGQIDGKNYRIECKNFFGLQLQKKANIFTMFEVLEHVPNPDEMLKNIKEVTEDNAEIFVSTAINSPVPDHIYLFRSVKDVLNMVEQCGFQVKNMICAAANGSEIKIAEEKEQPITIALRLQKNN